MSGEVSETPADYNRIREPVNEGCGHPRSQPPRRPRQIEACRESLRDAVPALESHSPILQFRCRDRRTSDLDGSPHRKLIVTATRPPTPLRLLRLRRGGFVGDDSST
ncbi:hypothetical protein HMPREF0724_11637 [Prescottella equi ATCC 33707]|uniref:Uncharacterized protein n=1 Tax=Prescottella equi ATCC 33707 TaxID=525370 RepID=E9SZT6_RHOHA|nr:hypothetical protein HMPREF0724_11637 [Prescottella equi ATCC 33707]